MLPDNRPSATPSTTLPPDQAAWNAVDISNGERQVLGPTTPWDWGNTTAEAFAPLCADHPMITSCLNTTTRQSAGTRR